MSLFMLHATGDPVIKIKLKPIAVGSHGHVLFSTYKFANAHGSTSYNEHEFGWLVVEGRSGKWDERKAYHYNGKKTENDIYKKYLTGKIGLKNPDKVLKELMEEYFFNATSTLEQDPYVYAIKANQTCFQGVCREGTTTQKTLGKKEAKVLHSSVRSSFYYRGVALFHNTYKRTSDIGNHNEKTNKGAVFDFQQEVYTSADDAYPNLYPYSEVDGLVLFDHWRFKIDVQIDLPDVRKQIEYCKSKKSKHTTFKHKNVQGNICQAKRQTKIITINYKRKEMKYTESYVVRYGKLVYAFEQQMDDREGYEWIWNCQFGIVDEKEAEALSSLGHGKTEDDNWNPNEIIGMYKKRMEQMRRLGVEK